jgi:hypothetical protein
VLAIAISVLVSVPFVITHLSAGAGHTHPAAQLTDSVSISQDSIDVQGAIIPIPEGWNAEDVGGPGLDPDDAYGFCLLPPGGMLHDANCLSAGGILTRVAKVLPGGQAVPLSGAFQHNCNGLMITPIRRSGSIGTGAASVVTITCGSNVASSSTYWANHDRTFTIQSPYNGDRSFAVAKWVAQQVDISHWAHADVTRLPPPQVSPGTK